MAIKASAAKEVEALTADLAGASAVARDAAVARLTVIGARAVGRLMLLAESGAAPAARIAALRALEAIGDPRALDTALRITGDGQAAVASAAVSLARVFFRHEKGAAAVDRLTAIALNGGLPDEIRAAAVGALKDLEPSTIAPLLQSLAGDTSALVRAEARQPRPAPPHAGTDGLSTATAPMIHANATAAMTRAADEGLPGDADTVRQMLVAGGSKAALPVLLRLIERIREREAAEPPGQRPAWTGARACAHLVLARRRSRVALYDLREWLERSSDPLPVDALGALSLVGDASCLEPIASSYARSRDAWWRDRLTDVFRAIVARQRLTKRHAAVKRLEKKYPAALTDLWAQ